MTIVFLFYKSNHKIKFSFIGVITLIFLMFIDFKLFLVNILEKLILIISDLNMSTLTLKKTLIVIQEGFSEGSTGRNILFEQAVDIIKDGFIPRGIGYYKAFTDYDYPHNIFLDLFIIFGYLSIPLVVVSIIAIIYYFKRETFILGKYIVFMF